MKKLLKKRRACDFLDASGNSSDEQHLPASSHHDAHSNDSQNIN